MLDKTFEESDQNKILENTRYYVENYLNPNKNWNRQITPKQRIERIRFANVNWKTISTYIRDMEYENFLKTPYWKSIAAHTKFKAGYRCQVCNSPHDLITHHRHYGIHGFEHAYMQELTVLCDDCHRKFHDPIPEKKFHAPILEEETSIPLTVQLLILLTIFATSYYLISSM